MTADGRALPGLLPALQVIHNQCTGADAPGTHKKRGALLLADVP